MTTDKEHLQWMLNRLVDVHGESRNVDYMMRMQQIISNTETELNLRLVSHYYLVNGDTINKGDEFQSADEKWRVTGQENEVFTSNNHYPHRRRTNYR